VGSCCLAGLVCGLSHSWRANSKRGRETGHTTRSLNPLCLSDFGVQWSAVPEGGPNRLETPIWWSIGVELASGWLRRTPVVHSVRYIVWMICGGAGLLFRRC